ncbi:MAG: cell division protein FtsL [Deltaproteobacteria bacterium]|jgi:cell division protein FtsL|nr:cell division protein FtsL [Deltaproteobacteria bacterium]
MGLFSFFSKPGPIASSGSLAIIQPKWKKALKAGSKNRTQMVERQRLERSRLPENQLLARLPDMDLGFLSAKNFFLVSLMVVAFFIGFLIIIRASHSKNELGMEVSRLTNYQVQLREENRRLKVELARLASLDDLETVARRDLGLVSPSQGQIVVID